ncbi:MAG: MarR family transcriptional regulator [Lachnospiraceae bacterium]|nr:MarR family transcriptional regulator [Lachnospiraceae bacterium]
MELQKPWSVVYKEIYTIMEKNKNHMFRESGITNAQMGVMIALDLSQKPRLTMKELEKKVCLAQSTVAGLVARLEQKGLVECGCDSEDRRIKWVRRSKTGIELCEHTRREMHKMDQDFLSGLTPEERELFVQLLFKVRASLEDMEAGDSFVKKDAQNEKS